MSDEYDEEDSSISIEEDDENFEENDDLDPEYVEYLQNSFQDEIVNDLFEKIKIYVKDNAIPICEYLEREDVEIIIQELALV